MIVLYHGSGSTDFTLVGIPTPRDEWVDVRRSVCRLLRARKTPRAAELLETIPFELYEGTNHFCDEFSLLYLRAPLEKYIMFEEEKKGQADHFAYYSIAETLGEIGSGIRFIAVDLDTNTEVRAVSSPSLAITSETVESALADCEQLIHSRGATSGVDRIHTVFHGYLLAVCNDSDIDIADKAGVTQLFKAIRRQHPSFVEGGPRAGDIDRIVTSMATIIDALNPLRNKATFAHPNDAVIKENEAMLVINSVRTLLHYMNGKFAN